MTRNRSFVKKRVRRSKSLLSRSYFSKSTKQTTLTSFPMDLGELKIRARKCGRLIPRFLLDSHNQKQTIHQIVKLGISFPQKIVDISRIRGSCTRIKIPWRMGEWILSDLWEMLKLWKTKWKWKEQERATSWCKRVRCPARNVIYGLRIHLGQWNYGNQLPGSQPCFRCDPVPMLW